MYEQLEQRVLSVACYIVENKATVRAAAKAFGVCKSTIHCDLTKRLKYLNSDLYNSVRLILDQNKAQRHIRGGRATYLKYKMPVNWNYTVFAGVLHSYREYK